MKLHLSILELRLQPIYFEISLHNVDAVVLPAFKNVIIALVGQYIVQRSRKYIRKYHSTYYYHCTVYNVHGKACYDVCPVRYSMAVVITDISLNGKIDRYHLLNRNMIAQQLIIII